MLYDDGSGWVPWTGPTNMSDGGTVSWYGGPGTRTSGAANPSLSTSPPRSPGRRPGRSRWPAEIVDSCSSVVSPSPWDRGWRSAISGWSWWTAPRSTAPAIVRVRRASARTLPASAWRPARTSWRSRAACRPWERSRVLVRTPWWSAYCCSEWTPRLRTAPTRRQRPRRRLVRSPRRCRSTCSPPEAARRRSVAPRMSGRCRSDTRRSRRRWWSRSRGTGCTPSSTWRPSLSVRGRPGTVRCRRLPGSPLPLASNESATCPCPTCARAANTTKHGKGSPYSITERRVPELIPVLDSQPAGDVSHKPDGRLPLQGRI